MGPHSIECGMCLLVQARSLARISLQWGRTLSSAECVVTATDDGHFLVSLLQWGRTLSSAEWRARCESWFAGDPVALMGPHSIECGMWNYSWKIIFRSSASMGPHSIECGMFLVAGCDAASAIASMGPHSIECGMSRHLASPEKPLSHASMGPHSIECGMFHLVQPVHLFIHASMGPH